MTLEARKIALIQEFLSLQSEEVISRFEEIIRNEKSASKGVLQEPMTVERLNKRIDQSESDFKNKRFKSSEELLAKYQ